MYGEAARGACYLCNLPAWHIVKRDCGNWRAKACARVALKRRNFTQFTSRATLPSYRSRRNKQGPSIEHAQETRCFAPRFDATGVSHPHIRGAVLGRTSFFIRAHVPKRRTKSSTQPRSVQTLFKIDNNTACCDKGQQQGSFHKVPEPTKMQ
jgi:hypothetical protein